jgi:polysaccharide export outer membrane protein
MKKWMDWALVASLVILCSLCAAAQETQPANARAEILPVKNMDLRVGLSAADAKYSIGVGDVLTVDVWKQPEVSRTLPVRTDGKISLPLINDVQAAGLTPTQLGTQIAEGLRRVMVNPQVTVIVNEINSQRIYIVGQVLRGGAYPLAPNLTIVQALSGAGFTPFANLKKIYVVRVENGQKKILPANFKEAVSRHNLSQDLSLKPGDTIVVP